MILISSKFNDLIQSAFETAIRDGKDTVILKLNYKRKKGTVDDTHKCPEDGGPTKSEDDPKEGGPKGDAPKEKKLTKGQLKKIRVTTVNTPEFKSWFGKSVISEKDGSPMVVYHGSGNPGHNTFQTDTDRKIGKSVMSLFGKKNETTTMGAWFTNNPRTAETFSKTGHEKAVSKLEWNKDNIYVYNESVVKSGSIYPVYLSLQNPKIYEPVTLTKKAKSDYDKWIHGDKDEWEEVSDPFEQMMDDRDEFSIYYGNHGADVVGERGHWRQRMAAKDAEGTNQKFVAKLKAEGHDGIVIRNTEYDTPRKGVTVDQYVIFEPSQVKSIFNPKPTSSAIITNSKGVPEEYVPPVKQNYKCPEDPPGSGNFKCDLPEDEKAPEDKTSPDEKPKKGKKEKGPWQPKKMPKYPERGVDTEFYREVENHLKKDVYTDEENILLDGWRHKDNAKLTKDEDEIMAGIMEKSTVPWGSTVYQHMDISEKLKEGDEISVDTFSTAYTSYLNMWDTGSRGGKSMANPTLMRIRYPAGSHIVYRGDDHNSVIIDKGSKYKVTHVTGSREYVVELVQDEKPPAPKRPPIPKTEGFDVNRYNKEWRKYTGKRFPGVSGGIGKMELDKLDLNDDTKKIITDTISGVEGGILKKLKLPGLRGIALYNSDFEEMDKSFAAFGDGVMWFNPKEIGRLNLEEDTHDGMVKTERERIIAQQEVIDEITAVEESMREPGKLGKYEKSVARIKNAVARYDDGDDSLMPWNYSKDNVEEGIRPSNCIHYFNTPEERMQCVIYHEMGHAVHQLYGVRNLDRYEATMWNNNSYSPFEKEVAKTMYSRDGAFLPSTYSIKNPKEWFAENFALYKMGRHDCVDDKALDLFKKMEAGGK